MWKPATEKSLSTLGPGEWNQRINIAFSRDRLVENDGTDDDNSAQNKSPDIEQGCQYK